MSTTLSGHERIQSSRQHDSAKNLKRTLMGGALIEALGAVTAIVLVIIGLSGVAPITMGAIAAIAVGIGLLSEAGTLVAEYPKIISQTQKRLRDKIEFSTGFSAEALAGITAIVLGILVLLGVDSLLLLSITALVLGVGLVLTSAAVSFINSVDLKAPAGAGYEPTNAKTPESGEYGYELRKAPRDHEEIGEEEIETETVAHASLGAAIGVQVVLGFTATVLGILALVGFAPLALTLVSILVVSIAVLMVGAAISGRMLSAHTV